MKNERRLIDLDKIKPIDFPSYEMDGLDVVQYLNTLPTVDAVEVVRCRECKHCDPENHHCDHYMGTAAPLRREPDDFCSYGERKDDADNG